MSKESEIISTALIPDQQQNGTNFTSLSFHPIYSFDKNHRIHIKRSKAWNKIPSKPLFNLKLKLSIYLQNNIPTHSLCALRWCLRVFFRNRVQAFICPKPERELWKVSDYTFLLWSRINIFFRFMKHDPFLPHFPSGGRAELINAHPKQAAVKIDADACRYNTLFYWFWGENDASPACVLI